jgi:hypothetical protein
MNCATDLRNTQNSATPKYLLVGNISFFSFLENDQNSSIKTCSNQLNYFATTNPQLLSWFDGVGDQTVAE